MKFHTLITRSHHDTTLSSGTRHATPAFSTGFTLIRSSGVRNGVQSAMFALPWDSCDLFAIRPGEDRDSEWMIRLSVAKSSYNLATCGRPDERCYLGCNTDGG